MSMYNFTKTTLALLLLSSFSGFSLNAHAKQGVAGVDHVGLSVSSLKASEDFFVKQIGFQVIKRDLSYPAVFLKNDEVILTLWQVNDPQQAVKFDRKNNVGLHHLAFKVSSFEALQAMYEKLKPLKNIKIQFSPELLSGGPAKHMMLFEPSGNRIEFIHRPGK